LREEFASFHTVLPKGGVHRARRCILAGDAIRMLLKKQPEAKLSSILLRGQR
jgi:hypothetical protein